jgi:polyhydroxyalkanoate synthesis regulator phasin
MHTYYEVKDMLKEELDQIVKKGELSAGSLETIDKLLNSIKNACKITMYEEYKEDGYSYADGDMDMSRYAYARGRGSNARRDSMGRYSREGGYSRAEEKEDELRDIVNQLRSMAKDLPQPTQRAIQNFTEMVG